MKYLGLRSPRAAIEMTGCSLEYVATQIAVDVEALEEELEGDPTLLKSELRRFRSFLFRHGVFMIDLPFAECAVYFSPFDRHARRPKL